VFLFYTPHVLGLHSSVPFYGIELLIIKKLMNSLWLPLVHHVHIQLVIVFWKYLQLQSLTSILTLMNLLCWDFVNILQLETLFVLGDEERMDS
jgi:hypothetical protein